MLKKYIDHKINDKEFVNTLDMIINTTSTNNPVPKPVSQEQFEHKSIVFQTKKTLL